MSGDRNHPEGGVLFAVSVLVNIEGGGTYTLRQCSLLANDRKPKSVHRDVHDGAEVPDHEPIDEIE
jgi:hypothetical protein